MYFLLSTSESAIKFKCILKISHTENVLRVHRLSVWLRGSSICVVTAGIALENMWNAERVFGSVV